MRKIGLLTSLCLSFALTSCAVHTRDGSIVVDPDRSSHPHDRGDFCPPGQAKKGRC
ncbi:hypothetical protein H0S58_03720 [Acinetobacter sp. TTH0-4]|jgi:hypothetical protein|uniref:hypothetical protein n=1 Tax=Acinetobacter sp. TTH0-4 TaxID=1646498 RepID=UPI00189D2FBB|nr:hypothetical protein [Acinetobacter sp. TTH0-4]QPF38620.1 hypothetical protein H0S58_03720 [Acinetobacter sp. TTH0-4]